MTIEELSTRLQKVERQNLRMRAAGACGLVLAVAWMAMGQAAPPPKVVQAEKFELRDGEGKLLAQLGLTEHATPELLLYDTSGGRRITLAVEADGLPHLNLRDKAGNSRARLYVGSDTMETPVLVMCDKDRIRASLSARDRGPTLVLLDKNDKARAELAVFPDGSPVLELSDKSGKSVFKAPSK